MSAKDEARAVGPCAGEIVSKCLQPGSEVRAEHGSVVRTQVWIHCDRHKEIAAAIEQAEARGASGPCVHPADESCNCFIVGWNAALDKAAEIARDRPYTASLEIRALKRGGRK